MTPREELIAAVEWLPDDLMQAILALVRVWQRRPVSEDDVSSSDKTTEPETVSERMVEESRHMLTVDDLPEVSSRLRRKQGILVIETGSLSKIDATVMISEMREERIQKQIDRAVS